MRQCLLVRRHGNLCKTVARLLSYKIISLAFFLVKRTLFIKSSVELGCPPYHGKNEERLPCKDDYHTQKVVYDRQIGHKHVPMIVNRKLHFAVEYPTLGGKYPPSHYHYQIEQEGWHYLCRNALSP